MNETPGIIIKSLQEGGKIQVSGSFSTPFSIWQERIWGCKMDGLELREESVFTPEQEENIAQRDACSKNVSRCQCRAVMFYRFWLCPSSKKKFKCDFESHRYRA
jgi:hypothetical protein